MSLASPQSQWKPFERHPRAAAIAESLKDIPCHWSLTILSGKQPLRQAWQSEPFIPHSTIADLLITGEPTTNKSGRPYRRFWSGYGLRLGEPSGGLLAIDIDGESAEPILQSLSGGDVPITVSWTSGKPGRRQLVYQIPDTCRERLKRLTRIVLTEHGELKTADGEMLEFRYDRCQSALPPSYHPTTGGYKWIDSPVNMMIAIAPDWLCKLLISFTERESRNTEAKQHARAERERIVRQSTEQRQALGIVGSIDLVDTFNQSIQRLSPEEIFNWPGHGFKTQGGEWVGCCPNHQSQSGESFTVNPASLKWHCFGCGVGGGAAEYRHFLSGGSGTPKGKDFYLVTKPLAEQAGVAMPANTKATEIPYVKPIKELPGIGFHILRKTQDALLSVFDELKTVRGQDWLRLRQFTPSKVIDQQYFDYDFKSDESLAIKSGLGTGKSYFVNAKWLTNPNEGAVLLGYRNCLNEQFCANGEKLNGRVWYQIQQDLKGQETISLIADPESRIAGAVDSCPYFASHHYDEKRVIFDEVESVASHLNRSSTAVSFYRDLVKQRVQDSLQNSKANLIADGNLRDFTVSYFEKLSGRKFTKIQNQYKGNRGHVYLYNGSSRKRQATECDVKNGLAQAVDEWISFGHKLDDASKLHRIMMDLPTDVPILILSDSQSKCEAWDRELTALGRKVFRLDSSTSQSDLGRLFLKNPREFILSERIDTVILSPSAESGVSVELQDELKRQISGYFKYEFAFFFGVSTTDTQVQFLGRNRDPYTTRFAYVQSNSIGLNKLITNSDTSTTLYQNWMELSQYCAHLSLQGLEKGEILKLAMSELDKKLDDPHLDYESKLDLKESFEKAYPRLCLEYALRDAGWSVTLIEGREDTLEDLRTIQQEIAEEKAQAIFQSQNISQTEEKVLSRKLNKTSQERSQIAKSRLLNRLPGIEEKIIVEQKKVTTPEQLQIVEQQESTKIMAVDDVVYEEWKESSQSIPEKGIELTIEKPAFSPEFIDKVLNKDRAFVSRIQSQFLLKNPDLCKTVQQYRWHKKLSAIFDPDTVNFGGLPVAHYRSKWVEVHTLLEMGIGWFLQSQNSWHDESPEAIAFWEKGSNARTAKLIGIAHEDSPCTYIGKVLKRFGLRTQSKQKSRPDKTRHRSYSIAPLDSLSQAVYECVEQRISSQVCEFVFDWKKIVQNSTFQTAETLTGEALPPAHLPPDNYKKTRGVVCIAAGRADTASQGAIPHPVSGHDLEKNVQNSTLKTAQIPTEQAFQAAHLPPDNYIKTSGDVCIAATREDVAIQGTVPHSVSGHDLESLIGSLTEAGTPEQFWRLVEGRSPEVIEDAIFLQPLDARQQLSAWYEAGDMTEGTAVATPLPKAWQWTELPIVRSILRWIDRSERLTLLNIEPDGRCQVRSQVSGLVRNTRLDQLRPLEVPL